MINRLNIPDANVIQTGEGPDLLMLHSLLADRSVFDRVLPELSLHYRLTIPNLPGYGDAPMLSQASPVINEYADYICAIMDKAALPANTAVLGNGAGGFIAVALGIRYGSRIGKLILADTGPGFPVAAKRPLHMMADTVEDKGMAAVLEPAIQRLFPETYIAAQPDVVAERKAALADFNPTAFARLARALAGVEMYDDLNRIQTPTLVMVGLEDSATPPEMSRQLHGGIADSRLIQIPGCGHCPPIQTPREFLHHVCVFLDERTSSRND
jgi:3-oxoadipate enol-lactonase